jgi:hypothetical protein
VGNAEGKRPVDRGRRKLENNNKINLGGIKLGGMD